LKILQRRLKTLLSVLLILFIVYEILCWLATPASEHPYFKQDKFLVIAHRGGSSLGPENTLYKFHNAVKMGVDVLEMDVRSTKDKQLIILHDNSVTRTTDGTGAVENYILAELKKLDAAHRWSPDNGRSFPLRNQGIKIPTLSEIFTGFPHTRVNLELKDTRSETIQSLCHLIQSHHMTEKVIVASFDAGALKDFRAACPQVATSAGSSEVLLFYGLQKLYLESVYTPKPHALQVPFSFQGLNIVNSRFVEAAHSRNMRVHVWTVNDIDSMKQLIEIGVDGIMTDYPQRLLVLLREQ